VQGIGNICILSADHSNHSISNCLVTIIHTKPVNSKMTLRVVYIQMLTMACLPVCLCMMMYAHWEIEEKSYLDALMLTAVLRNCAVHTVFQFIYVSLAKYPPAFGRPGIWPDLCNSVLTAPLTSSSGHSVCRYYTVTIKATLQQHTIVDDHFHMVLS